MIALVLNENDVYVTRTIDSGATWTRTKLDLPAGDGIVGASFATNGTEVVVKRKRGSSSFVTRDRGVTWQRVGSSVLPPT